MRVSLISTVYHACHFDTILSTYAWQEDDGDSEVLFMVTSPDPKPLMDKIAGCSAGRGWRSFGIPRAGNVEARNLGAANATGDVLVFVDGDQLLSSNLIAAHRRAHEDTPFAIGVGITNINFLKTDGGWEIQGRDIKVPASGEFEFMRSLGPEKAATLAFWHNEDNHADYINVVGRNVSVRKSDFNEMGMWDAELTLSEKSTSRGWEDVEFGIRAYECGMRFEVVPAWTVHLEHPRFDKDKGAENVERLAKKHPWFLRDRPEWFKDRGYEPESLRKITGV